MTNDVAYVTQEMWDRAQAALRAVLPHIHVPPLSTSGTMVSLRKQIEAAIVGGAVEPRAQPRHVCVFHYTGGQEQDTCVVCGAVNRSDHLPDVRKEI